MFNAVVASALARGERSDLPGSRPPFARTICYRNAFI
jgi:hypothetical protein